MFYVIIYNSFSKLKTFFTFEIWKAAQNLNFGTGLPSLFPASSYALPSSASRVITTSILKRAQDTVHTRSW